MELGNKIKILRLRAGMTQEMLAEELGVSFQTISKWENSVCAPDIMMLPRLSVYFGVTIDELFDLTAEQRLRRIENMLEMEQELPHSTFTETIDFLQEQLEGEGDKARIYGYLAHVYTHRVMSDCEKINKYAEKAMLLDPKSGNFHWFFQKAAGAVPCDWNVRNRHQIISIYKKLVTKHPKVSRNYLELMDNLIADNRTKEAAEYLKKYMTLEDHMDFQIPIYEARIALAEHDPALAELKFKELEESYPGSSSTAFEMGNYHADQCRYEKAIEYYEKSVAIEMEKGAKPIYTDAFEAIAMIYEIREEYDKALETYDRILKLLEEEYGLTEGESVREVMVKKQRLMELMK